MSINEVLSKKSTRKEQIRKLLGIKTKSRALGFICPAIQMNEDFMEGLSFSEADFVVLEDISGFPSRENIFSMNKEDILESRGGFDFFLCNGETENMQEMLTEWIVPILYEKNYLSWLLQEFNPIKGEGNCFLYKQENKWSMYTALVKYLENYKFPYDNKSLVKNTVQI